MKKHPRRNTAAKRRHSNVGHSRPVDDFVPAELHARRDENGLGPDSATDEDAIDRLLLGAGFDQPLSESPPVLDRSPTLSTVDHFEPDLAPALAVPPTPDEQIWQVIPVTLDEAPEAALNIRPQRDVLQDNDADTKPIFEPHFTDEMPPTRQTRKPTSAHSDQPLTISADFAAPPRHQETAAAAFTQATCHYQPSHAWLATATLIAAIFALLATLALGWLVNDLRGQLVKLNGLVEVLKDDAQLGRDRTSGD